MTILAITWDPSNIVTVIGAVSLAAVSIIREIRVVRAQVDGRLTELLEQNKDLTAAAAAMAQARAVRVEGDHPDPGAPMPPPEAPPLPPAVS